jgi:predicted nucleic acid-binding protein
MKVLDTPVLVDLLRGRIDVRTLLGQAKGEELATTELNVFELEVLARLGPRAGREHRLAAVQRLRRKLTVLPIDERACQAAAVGQAARPKGGGSIEWLMLGAAKAAGASAWWTVAREHVPALEGVESVSISNKTTKNHRERA